MARKYTAIAFTRSVKDAQEHYGTREKVARMEAMDLADDVLTEREAEFIQERDGFYVASVGEEGWPYLQFRGGPEGFLKVLDERTLGFSDFRGNLQYITTGNVRHDDRVALFLMDYAGRRRLKIMAHARIHDADDRPDLAESLEDADHPARVERFVTYRIAGYDWNCPKHITPRFTEEEWHIR